MNRERAWWAIGDLLAAAWAVFVIVGLPVLFLLWFFGVIS